MQTSSNFKLPRFAAYSLAALALWSFAGFSQTYTGEPSNRVTINLGNTPWKFIRDASNTLFPAAKAKTYNDNTWEEVGVPHSYNAMNTYLNVKSGIGSATYRGSAWYRKHFTLDSSKYKGRRIMVEFQGVNIGSAVYVNGTFKPGITSVAQPGEVTHVTGHLPFVIDITNDLAFGQDNVIAVRVNNSEGNPFYTWPKIGINLHFGMGMGGIIRPVLMHITDKVHVPLNVFPTIRRWGTYVATTAATPASATVRIQTNVYNDDAQSKAVTVTTKIVDAQNNVVATQTTTPQTINAGANYVFDQTAAVSNPQLWFPAASVNGKPYMYKVFHIVQAGSETVDVFQSPLGIRVITWDKDFPYFSGKKELLWGFGSRYEYPALGMALSDEIHWRDVKLMADCGGKMLRPGHVPASPATVAACDAFGVCLIENTMDDEWKSGEPVAYPYKKEFHRDCIIRDRNNPSVVVWELDNGPYERDNIRTGITKPLLDTIKKWDHLTPRVGSTRNGDVPSPVTPSELIVGYVTWEFRKYPLLPGWFAEVYSQCVNRITWESQVEHTDKLIMEFRKARDNSGCGFAHWMFSESQGESYTTYYGEPDASLQPTHKSLGGSATDQNRIPKLIYHVWKNALWIPYSVRPGVALQSHWNYSAGTRTVTAYSNCPRVELFVNNNSKGVKTPAALTAKCEWTAVAWESGTLRVVGQDAAGTAVCSDERKTAGTPHHIVLTAEPPLAKPDGSSFVIRANGSDAGFFLATIVDAAGNWCPLANNNITFTTSGPGTYVGSSNFLVTAGKPETYHAPGDPELMAEGGQMKVAVRSTFTSGTISVSASSPGLVSGTASFQTHPADAQTAITPRSGASLNPGTTAQNRTMKVVGNSFFVPDEFAGKPVLAMIYDLSGRHLKDMVLRRAGKVHLGKGLQKAGGAYIVRYKVLPATANE